VFKKKNLKVIRINYTTYDLRSYLDSNNPQTHPDIMTLWSEDTELVNHILTTCIIWLASSMLKCNILDLCYLQITLHAWISSG
jgi:hypothetical protein